MHDHQVFIFNLDFQQILLLSLIMHGPAPSSWTCAIFIQDTQRTADHVQFPLLRCGNLQFLVFLRFHLYNSTSYRQVAYLCQKHRRFILQTSPWSKRFALFMILMKMDTLYSFGLSLLVVELARLGQDAQKKKELVECYNACLQHKHFTSTEVKREPFRKGVGGVIKGSKFEQQ
ncbi:hypothetical protein CR513_57736, partial [Mucuna pruriens]